MLTTERVATVAETNLLEQLAGSLLQRLSGLIWQEWRGDVVRRRQCRQQMESLEDEANPPTVVDELPGRQFVELRIPYQQRA